MKVHHKIFTLLVFFVFVGAGCASQGIQDDQKQTSENFTAGEKLPDGSTIYRGSASIRGTYTFSDMLGVACFNVAESDRNKLPNKAISICFLNSSEAERDLKSIGSQTEITIKDIEVAPSDYVDPGKYRATYIGM